MPKLEFLGLVVAYMMRVHCGTWSQRSAEQDVSHSFNAFYQR